jgi:DNA-binding transcriptional regulator YbjK
MRSRLIQQPARRRRTCRCPRRRSPIVDTAHSPLARWGLTAVALLALAADMAWPFVIIGALAAWTWRHR